MIGRPLWICLKYLLRGLRRRPATVLYPFEKVRLPYQWRGLHRLDDTKCNGCGSCSRACPNLCIEIVQVAEKKKRPSVDIGRCLFCGYCVDACPFDAMHMTGNYELAVFSREELVLTPEKLSKVEDVREGTLDEELWKRVYGKEEIPAWPPLPEKVGKGKKDAGKKEDVKGPEAGEGAGSKAESKGAAANPPPAEAGGVTRSSPPSIPPGAKAPGVPANFVKAESTKAEGESKRPEEKAMKERKDEDKERGK